MSNFRFGATWSDRQWDSALTIWENASIKILDVRHRLIEGQTALQPYQLPAHAFLFALNGPSSIRLGEVVFDMERFAMLHVCKGSEISIRALGGWLDFYLILYKPSYNAMAFARDHNLENNPLHNPLALSVRNPIFYANCCRSMYDQWQQPSVHRQIHAKSGFYQFIEQLHSDRLSHRIESLPVDIVQNAIVYMGQNFHLPLTIQGIADSLGISHSQLNRLFKKKLGIGPLEYLKELRIQAARRYMEQYPVSLREVANATGIYDEFYLSRLIKQRFNMTAEEIKQKNTRPMRNLYMESEEQAPYTNTLKDNDYHYHNEGEEIILNKWKSNLLLTAALSVILTLSACGTTGNSVDSAANQTTAPSGAPGGATGTPSAPTETTNGATRIVSTEMGDVEIPTMPERIIAPFIQGDLLALGIKPVGTSFNDDAVFEEEIGNTSIGIPWELDLEAIMALEPDLIIYGDPDAYEKLSLIAPTVIISDLYANMEFDRILMLGELVGRKEKAEELYNQLIERVASSKARLEEAGLMDKTVVLMDWQDGRGATVWGNKYGRGGELIYNFLGLKAPQRVLDEIINNADDPKYLDLSLEVVAEYQADYIFSDEYTVAGLEGNSIWENLTAVREGRLIQVSAGMFWFNDILSAYAQLDVIVNEILERANR